ncbi:MAG: zinc dependent phospholipase C family protein [Methanothermobacter wolfeii]|nr:zinc dependent phospholipase C family protein [Methanothermobacter wolfeii]
MRFIILAAVLILAASQIQGAHAWSIKNHHGIAESVYHAMPEDVRSKLSLDEMKNGADDPDTVFFDFKYHTYPYTTQKASFWLNQGKISYESGNYRYASYCFGVASHYISDGVCGPHTSGGSSRYFHTLYELRAMMIKPGMAYTEGETHEEAAILWRKWVLEGDDRYISDALDMACGLSYREIMNSIGYF